MKNIKQFFTYLVVGALVMALSVACSEDAPTSSGITHSSHPPQGTYVSSLIGNPIAFASQTNGKATVVNNLDGTCHITGTAYYYQQYDGTDYQNFDITITKWYQPNDSSICYAGSANGMFSYLDIEQSEATINLPSGVDFGVSYDVLNSELSIVFGPEGKSYSTSSLVRQ